MLPAAARHDADFPPLGPPSRQQSISSLGRSTPPVPPGFEAHARNNSESRRSTPVAPPGLSKLAAPIGALQGLGMVGKDTTVPAAASTSIAARATSTAAPALAGRVSAVATPVGTPRLVPAVPAGLEGVGSRPSSRASLKRAGSYHITPAVPLRPATPIRTVTPTITPRVEGKARVQEVETPTKAPKTDAAKFRGSTKTAEDKAEDESAKAGAEKEVEVQPENAEDGDAVQKRSVEAAVSAMVAPKEVKVESTAPSSTAPKHSVVESAARATVAPQTKGEPAPPPVQKSAPKAMQPIAKGQATTQSSTAEAAPVTPSKAETTKNDQQQKRKQPPGKLDISAAVQPDIQAASSKQTAETPVQARAKDQPAAASPATSKVDTKAGSPSVASPAIKIAPKTLRVVATPKTETPPAGVTTPKDAVSAVPPVPAKAPSRKPSVASINLPGTPSSEQVSASDNISIPSASQSRANSPPPMAGSSKVGSAPVKAKTKNQLKKERRAKAIEEEKEKPEELTKAVPEEPAQEAIVSRKKKTKKEKEHKPPKPKASAAVDAAGTTKTGESTPTTSRPVTPQAATPPVPSKPEPALKDVKTSKPSTPTRAPIGQQPLPMFSPSELSPPPTPTLSAAQLIAELKATAPEIQKCIDSLFRSPASSTNYKPTQPITAKDLAAFKQDFKLDLTQSEVRALLSGSVPAVRYGGGDKGSTWDRGLVSPTGAHLRALTQELETRFLELEKAIHELPEELQFNPSKPQNNVKFPSVDLEALKRQFENIGGRNVSVMEQMVQDGSTMKKGAFLVDEASKYINEFVMPPATPPPSVGGGSVPATTPVQGKVAGEGEGMSVAALEQQLGKARKDAEDREGALRKVMKKNKKVLGLA